MYVQMCIKGLSGFPLDEAKAMLTKRGIACNWWRDAKHLSSAAIDQRLTPAELDLHVNSYDEEHPERGGKVRDQTPFISLTAGAVERNSFLQTNQEYSAHRVATNFALQFGKWRGDFFLFYCWVVVGMRPSLPVRHLAEEVRELNTYRAYSAFQLEGEIAAKIEVPARQIQKFEHYTYTETRPGRKSISFVDSYLNPDYIEPHEITNYRDWF
jgi:hypothetical protein